MPCGSGYYCPGGDTTGARCPAGKYNNKAGAKLPSECVDCPAGWYCLPGSINPTGKCQQGYYCQGGASSKAPNSTHPSFPLNGPCQPGRYCPEGTPAPVKCPEGRVRASEGAASASDCSLCDPGSYCKGTGLITPTGKCYGGWYCPEGSVGPTPKNYTCWPGHSCPNGTAQPRPCVIGECCAKILYFESGCIICKHGKWSGILHILTY